MIEPIQPVVVAIDVRRGVQEAFRVFTEEIAGWWPVAAHSVEPDRVAAVVLEGRPGGRVYERWQDGGQADWGRVVAWEPPNRLVLSWSPDPERPAATEVEVRFTAGGPPATRGEWLVSHVYAVLGRPEPALRHARRCLDLADGDPGAADFDHAYTAEAMSRAMACAGELDQAAAWHSRATAAGAAIADDQDRKIFAEDLATGPWYGLNGA
jgi:uncharacterized protein YndB with AHSA1/START domain